MTEIRVVVWRGGVWLTMVLLIVVLLLVAVLLFFFVFAGWRVRK